jgi:hypothetical protein
MHPADIVRYVETEDCLKAFTEEELTRLIQAIDIEYRSRQPQPRGNDATATA